MSMTPFSVSDYMAAHRRLMEKIDLGSVQFGIEMVRDAFINEKRIFTCGNGGSASTASHYIVDWNKMVSLTTRKKFQGVSLCDNVGLITAFGNDFSFDDVFSGQVDSLMSEGDLLVAVSGSGNSSNVLKAIKSARRSGGKVLGVVGYDGGAMMSMCDHCVWIPSFDMQLCEDVHLMFGHMVMKSLCETTVM
jgi:D-sedoheptulose 7-phosphate isomerase